MIKKQNKGGDKTATLVKGGPVRVSFAHVFKPRAMEDDPDGKKKYSIVLLIPKTNKALIKLLRAGIDAAIEKGKTSKWSGKIPAGLRKPLRDGDVERPDNPEFEGCWFITASSDRRPGVIDLEGNKLTEDDEYYSGCYSRFQVNFFPYNTAGNKGVGCGLNNLQKTKDGERLAGGMSAEDAFADDYKELDTDEDFDDEEGLLG